MTMRAAFVTLEGIEGVGKSTNLVFVETYLRSRGIETVTTREPGGTDLGEKIRAWVLHEDHGALSAEVEALLMFAARAHHLDRIIRPALEAGRWVICDRFTDATLAYQGAGRGASPALLEALASGIQHGVEPDLTLLLDAPLDVAFQRTRKRQPDHFEREASTFFERVRGKYLELAKHHPVRMKVIDATRPLVDVQRQIAVHLDALLARGES